MTPPLNSGKRNRIPWDEAFDYYVSLGRGIRSCGKVAERFGCSRRSVEIRSSRDRWQERAHVLDERAGERAAAKTVRSLADRRKGNIAAAELLRRRIELESRVSDSALRERIDLDTAYRHLANLAKLEELYEGQATERVERREILTLLAIFRDGYVKLGNLVDEERAAERDQVFSELEEQLKQLAIEKVAEGAPA